MEFRPWSVRASIPSNPERAVSTMDFHGFRKVASVSHLGRVLINRV